MATFVVLGARFAIPTAALERAPKSVLSEAASLRKDEDELIDLKSWPHQDKVVFKVITHAADATLHAIVPPCC